MYFEWELNLNSFYSEQKKKSDSEDWMDWTVIMERKAQLH